MTTMEAPPPPVKKLKTTTTTTVAAAAAEVAPPNYGSKEYWERRYDENNDRTKKDPLVVFSATTTASSALVLLGDDDDNVNVNDQEDPAPLHSWYFTYEELRPILLPILLGGKDDDDDDDTDESDDDEQEDNDHPGGEEVDRETNDQKPHDQKPHDQKPHDEPNVGVSGTAATESIKSRSEDDNEDDDDGATGHNKVADSRPTSSASDAANEIADDDCSVSSCIEEEEEEEGESEEEMIEEVVEIVADDDDDDASRNRPGLAKMGPVRVLEIGCGDVPLGVDLAKELLALQNDTGGSADAIVQQILCTDFSETVIRKLQQQPSPSYRNNALTFRTMDARAMDLPDASYELILDKGTLDAMLSDPNDGVKNCVAIVAECARVMTAPGCIVLVSHLNAHTLNGVQWLHEVVFEGLKRHSRNANFHVDIHGNDVVEESSSSVSSDHPGNDGVTKATANQSAGPAVYVIHKHYKTDGEKVTVSTKNGADDDGKVTKNDDDDDDEDDDSETVSIIPVQFFTYS
jgi:Methyltransferase domain